MMKKTGPFKVGDWLVEPELLQISCNGITRKLEFKTMETLLCLVANQDEVVSKQQLHDTVWKEVYVTDNALTRTVSKLRKAFDDDPIEPRYIDTISKSGYRLIAPILFDQDHAGHRQASTPQIIRNKRWIWGVAAVLLVGVFSIMSIPSKDAYSRFYDPIPVSTLIGPEIGHTISANGEKISFTYIEPGTNNPDVYVKLLNDQSQVKFTQLDSHQGFGIWSPDGNYMAYVSAEDGSCGIYREPSFRGEKIRIGTCYQSPDDFVWSPDGSVIAFTDINGQQSRRIYFLDVDTQEIQEVLTPEAGTSHRDPAFTSDGRFLVFRESIDGSGSDIYKLRLSDNRLTRLTFDNSRIFGLDIFDNDKQVVFSSNRGGQWSLWKIPITGGPPTRFFINDRILLEPKVSSDGKRLIYKGITDQTQLWSLKLAGSQYKENGKIASSTRADMHPSISGDGSKLVFISSRSGSFELWCQDLNNGALTKLTSLEGSFVNMPSWSQDASEVVFDARVNGNSVIYLLDVASKMTRKFVDLDGDQLNARFSLDGKSIYFSSNHTGNWQIWKKSAFNTQDSIRQITQEGGFHLQEGVENDYLYFVRSDTAGIWRMKEDESAELFISNVGSVDWGSWTTTKAGIIYLDRTIDTRLYLQPYDMELLPSLIHTPAKPVQLSSPTLSATADGMHVILAQIEKSEDEIMMIDLK